MAALVISLLGWIKLIGGYPVPAHLPTVALVPHAVLEARACGRPCPVVGWFPPGDLILLDDRLDPEGDLRSRGILVHELVHYVQQVSGRFEGMEPCTAAIAREREAYSIQNRWLAHQGALPGQAVMLHRTMPCGRRDGADPSGRPAGGGPDR